MDGGTVRGVDEAGIVEAWGWELMSLAGKVREDQADEEGQIIGKN